MSRLGLAACNRVATCRGRQTCAWTGEQSGCVHSLTAVLLGSPGHGNLSSRAQPLSQQQAALLCGGQ